MTWRKFLDAPLVTEEWFYNDAGSRVGPVSSAELKQLADGGRIGADTLIWRKGMERWVAARAVRGLFTAAPVEGSEPPPPPRRSDSTWHPFDPVIEAFRAAFPDDLAARISFVAGQVGVFAIYPAAALLLVMGLLTAVRSGEISALGIFTGTSLGLIVAQFVAQRLLGSCRAAITSNRSVISSLAVPDSLFVIAVVTTVVGTCWFVWFAISDRSLVPLGAAVATLVVGTFASLVCIQPAGLGVQFRPGCRAGEEAVGVLTFLLKLVLRCAPLLFAAAVVIWLIRVLVLIVRLVVASGDDVPAILFEAGLVIPGLLAAVAVPLYAYLLMLVYYLTLDVIQAIVSIPGKLDALADPSQRVSDRRGDEDRIGRPGPPSHGEQR